MVTPAKRTNDKVLLELNNIVNVDQKQQGSRTEPWGTPMFRFSEGESGSKRQNVHGLIINIIISIKEFFKPVKRFA